MRPSPIRGACGSSGNTTANSPVANLHKKWVGRYTKHSRMQPHKPVFRHVILPGPSIRFVLCLRAGRGCRYSPGGLPALVLRQEAGWSDVVDEKTVTVQFNPSACLVQEVVRLDVVKGFLKAGWSGSIRSLCFRLEIIILKKDAGY